MQELKQRNKSMLVKYNFNHNQEKIKLHLLIAKLLVDPKLFVNLYVDKALDLLYDLGYNTNEAMQKYVSLVAKQSK